jgi:hypothetical protein
VNRSITTDAGRDALHFEVGPRHTAQANDLGTRRQHPPPCWFRLKPHALGRHGQDGRDSCPQAKGARQASLLPNHLNGPLQIRLPVQGALEGSRAAPAHAPSKRHRLRQDDSLPGLHWPGAESRLEEPRRRTHCRQAIKWPTAGAAARSSSCAVIDCNGPAGSAPAINATRASHGKNIFHPIASAPDVMT